ncbi:MAG: AAA family ATPase [Planctomycetota bacterium]
MIHLAGYRLGELLHESPATRVWRAVRESDSRGVVVKALRTEFPGEHELAKFRFGFTIGCVAAGPRVVEHLSCERAGNGYAIVTEDFGGLSLDRQPLATEGLEVRLQIGIDLARALADIHARQLVHKDVKPGNVVWDRRTGTLKLIDFGIASQLPREAASLVPPEGLEGTLAYLAPEQTGRTNRAVDSRSDLYAFGVTLYELIAGVRPFDCEDPMELVYCHLAREATPLIEVAPSTPRVLSRLVARLMTKDPAERYQSAHGAAHDLSIVLDELRTKGRVRTFDLGANDASAAFRMPDRLYGRSAERDTLLKAFDRAAFGSRELLMIAGYSGIGKSALVHEVHQALLERHGDYCSGKFDQFRRDRPYQGLADAFSDLLRQVLQSDPAHVRVVADRVRAALRDGGGVVAELVPELERLIGPQPAPQPLGPAESQNRLNRFFSALVRAFARAESPLVLFLDDLQWADTPSLALLTELATDQEAEGEGGGHLLLVGAYRDNEVDPTHALSTALKAIEQRGQVVRRVALGPLSLEAVGEMVADSLRRTTDDVRALAALVFGRSEGNPFHVRELLEGLHRDGALVFDADAASWAWTPEALRSLERGGDLVEILNARLAQLPAATRAVLEFAACVGGAFDIVTLARILERSRGDVARALRPALESGLVVPTDERYKDLESLDDEDGPPPAPSEDSCGYRFVHDRVHLVAHELLNEASRVDAHLSIGRMLLAGREPAELDEELMVIAGHFIEARARLEDPAERLKVAELLLAAGVRAKSSLAHGPAVALLEAGRSLLPEAPWSSHYELALELAAAQVEALRLGERYDEMEVIAAEVTEHARSNLDRVSVQNDRIQARISQRDPNGALEMALDLLDGLEVRLPRHPGLRQTLVELVRTRRAIRGRDPEELAGGTELSDPRLSAAVEVMLLNASSTYFVRPELFPILILRLVQISARHGNSSASAYGYMLYGMFLCGLFGSYKQGYEFGRMGFGLHQRYPDAALDGKLSMVWGSFVAHWSEPHQHCARELLAGWRPAVDGGDLEYGAYIVLQSFSMALFAGEDLPELLQRYADLARWLRNSRQVQSHVLFNGFWQAAWSLRGSDDGSMPLTSKLTGAVLDWDSIRPGLRASGDWISVAYVSLSAGFFAVHMDDPERALEAFRLTQRHVDQLFASHKLPVFWLYRCLARLGVAQAHGRVGRRRAIMQVKRDLARLRRVARHAPVQHTHRVELIRAEIQRLLGKLERASTHYRRALDAVRRARNIGEEALINQRYGEAWYEVGERDAGRVFLRNARQAYSVWGARSKVRLIEATYPELAQSAESRQYSQTMTALGTATATASTTSAGQLDLSTVLRASQAVASEVGLDRLLTRLLGIVLENAGARRCVIMLVAEDGSLCVEGVAQEGAPTVVGQSLSLVGLMAVAAEQASAELAPVPVSLAQHVQAEREVLVIDDLSSDARFATDPYVRARGRASVLCQPILDQGELAGILYLENDLVTGAFSAARVDLMRLLSGQVASSLAQARLYRSLEDKVTERTAQLEKQSRFIRATFGRYLSDAVVDSLFADEEGLDLGGENREITVVMADLRGFTGLAEGLPAQQVVALINNHLEVMTEVIMRHRGTIDEIMGDGLLLLFGAPLLGEDDVDRALACSVEMQRAVEEVNRRAAERGLPPVEMGIGVHTGEVVVGNIGSEQRSKYGVVGRAVNLCGRVESYTVGGQILISERTRERAGIELQLGASFEVFPKGVREGVTVHELLGVGGDVPMQVGPLKGASRALSRPIPIQFGVLTGKQAGEPALCASLVALGEREAVLEANFVPPFLADVELILDAAEARVYGKVQPIAAGAPADHFLVRFTSFSAAAAEVMSAWRAGEGS